MDTPPKKGRPPKYPFGSLKVGDACFVEGIADRVRPAAAMFGKSRGWRFATSVRGQFVRVERIA